MGDGFRVVAAATITSYFHGNSTQDITLESCDQVVGKKNMIRKILVFLGIFAAFLLIVTALQALLLDEDMSYIGPIDEELLTKLESETSGSKVLRITSHGGETPAAIKIGRLISKRDYSLVVSRYCLSACAQWIMPSTRNLVVEDGTLIGLHKSASWMKKVLLDSGRSQDADAYSEIASMEANFYRDFNVNSRMLIDPYNFKGIICFIPRHKSSFEFAAVLTDFGYYVPTKMTYEKLTGQKVTGRWAETKREIMNSMKKNVPPGVTMSLVPETSVGFKEIESLKVSECSTAQLESVKELR